MSQYIKACDWTWPIVTLSHRFNHNRWYDTQDTPSCLRVIFETLQITITLARNITYTSLTCILVTSYVLCHFSKKLHDIYERNRITWRWIMSLTRSPGIRGWRKWINPPKFTINLNIKYSHILHECMNTRKAKLSLRTFQSSWKVSVVPRL